MINEPARWPGHRSDAGVAAGVQRRATLLGPCHWCLRRCGRNSFAIMGDGLALVPERRTQSRCRC